MFFPPQPVPPPPTLPLLRWPCPNPPRPARSGLASAPKHYITFRNPSNRINKPFPIPPDMRNQARKVASRLREASKVLIVSHIDADGITAGSIASLALDAVGIENDVRFVKKLDEALVDDLKSNSDGHDLVWFTDLGSGYLHLLADLDCVVADHHVPEKTLWGEKVSGQSKKTLFDFGEPMAPSDPDILQVNPHLAGLDGSTDMSGAGATYLVALALDKDLKELAALAIVGAVGDLQDKEHGKLVGTNREILEDGIKEGVLEASQDIRWFGRETRPLYKFIQYASEPLIEGLSGNYKASMRFLMSLEINLKDGERWRAWADLSRGEQRKLISALSQYIDRDQMISEVYTLPKEETGTPLHDAKEFATLMNSCGRYERAELGMQVCKGDRSQFLDRALGLQGGHRKNLVESMKKIRGIGIQEMEHIQYVHAGDKVMDSIIGIVAGMILGSGDIPDDKPLFAFAEADDGIKVSGRATKQLVKRGLDLSELMGKATAELGGVGGGHNIAAGATIPPGTEEEFLKIADRMVGEQISA